MSNPHLPPELLNYIVDLLHDDPDALKKCCLVSKSWIPRTRKHLFAEVELSTEEHLESWKNTFPDPSTSPVRFTKSLRVESADVVEAAGVEAGGWLRGFSHIVHLGVETQDMDPGEMVISLTPFHGLSDTIKSLRVGSIFLPPSWIFDLILSFPLLEDLAVTSYSASIDDDNDSDYSSAAVRPLNPPVFTGALELRLEEGLRPIASRLLSLPDAVRFRNLTLTWHCGEDISLTMALVGECSHVLETLNIIFDLSESMSTSLDLSAATKLKVVTFRIDTWDVNWITAALRTITPEHRELRQISIDPANYSFYASLGAGARRRGREERFIGQWLELDRLLVQVWESRSISLKLLYDALVHEEREVREWMKWLLPVTTGGGMVDLANIW